MVCGRGGGGGLRAWHGLRVCFAGLCALLESKSRRLELALYCLTPTIQSIYACCIKFKYINR